MHRFALIPLDAVCAGDHLGQGIRREVDHARATGRLDGAPYPVFSLERVIGP
jgi:hypothetical protein